MAERKTTSRRTALRKPAAPRRRKKEIATREQIEERAYHLWLAGGQDPMENWLAAERELAR